MWRRTTLLCCCCRRWRGLSFLAPPSTRCCFLVPQVGYQASSSGWGGARVECLEGCACEPSEFGGAKQAQQGEASPAGLMHEVLVSLSKREGCAHHFTLRCISANHKNGRGGWEGGAGWFWLGLARRQGGKGGRPLRVVSCD